MEKLHKRYPQYWHRIAVAEALVRMTQWDRMMEDRLLDGLSELAATEAGAWSALVEDSHASYLQHNCGC